MPDFDLPENFIDNPESLLWKRHSSAISSPATPPTDEPVTPAISATSVMARTLRDYSVPVMARTLHDYSVPTVANMLVRAAVNMGVGNFKLKTDLITMVQPNQFCSLPSEDANAHLQHFLELCNTIIIKDVTPTSIRLCLFSFYLTGKAKQWFCKDRKAVDTWDKRFTAFLRSSSPWAKPMP
jgi:hypothetical protein